MMNYKRNSKNYFFKNFNFFLSSKELFSNNSKNFKLLTSKELLLKRIFKNVEEIQFVIYARILLKRIFKKFKEFHNVFLGRITGVMCCKKPIQYRNIFDFVQTLLLFTFLTDW